MQNGNKTGQFAAIIRTSKAGDIIKIWDGPRARGTAERWLRDNLSKIWLESNVQIETSGVEEVWKIEGEKGIVLDGLWVSLPWDVLVERGVDDTPRYHEMVLGYRDGPVRIEDLHLLDPENRELIREHYHKPKIYC